MPCILIVFFLRKDGLKIFFIIRFPNLRFLINNFFEFERTTIDLKDNNVIRYETVERET